MILLLKAGAFLIGHMPIGFSILIARALGSIAYTFDKRHRKVIMENLERAFKDSLSKSEKERVSREVFKNMAMTFLEFMRIPWLKRESLEGYVDCTGIENLENALSKKNGVILVTAHFGNWELMASYYGLNGHIIDIVARDPDNPVFGEFVRWVRSRSGNRVISKSRAMRKLLKSLSGNGIIGILLDQNVTHREGFFVDFFGTLACTNKGPALLAATSGAPVLPTFIVREGSRHKIVVGREVELSSTGDKERDAENNTALFTKVIEDMIRKYPEQWFWMHRRWKTRPE